MTRRLGVRQIARVLLRPHWFFTPVFLFAVVAEGSLSDDLIEVEDVDGCLGRAHLSELVSAFLKGAEPPLDLSVLVTGGEAPGFVVYREGSEVAERRFERLPESCEARHEAIAVAIAVAIEHALVASLDEESSNTVSDSPVVDEGKRRGEAGELSEGSIPLADSPREDTESVTGSVGDGGPIAYRMSLGGGGIVGVLLEPALFLSADAELLPMSTWSVGVGFLYSTEVRTAFEVGSAVSQLAAGRLRGCYEPQFHGMNLSGCMGLYGGRLAAEGQGLWQASSAASYWVAVSTELGLRLPFAGRFGLHPSLDLFANLLRPGVQDRSEGGEVKSAPILGGAASLDFFVLLE